MPRIDDRDYIIKSLSLKDVILKQVAGTTTSDDTPTQIIAIPFVEKTIKLIEAKCIGIGGTADAVRGLFHIEGSFYRLTGGDVSQQGSTSSIHSEVTDGGLAASFSLDTGNQQVIIMVTGLSATSMMWNVYVNIETLTDTSD